MADKTALLLGATGLTGGFLLLELIRCGRYKEIIVPVRKEFKVKSPLVRIVVTDFKTIEADKANYVADDVFCCLGTTIAKVKTKEAFRHVDLEIPLEFARVTKENGAQLFSLMSSIGANAGTWNFYLKTKGEVENSLKALGFDRLHIFRPSMLLGPRKEARAGEQAGKVLMKAFSFTLVGPWKNYKPIESVDVARAMCIEATDSEKGVKIFESSQIQAIADGK